MAEEMDVEQLIEKPFTKKSHKEDKDNDKYEDTETCRKERHDKHKRRSHHEEKKRSRHGDESDEEMEEKKRRRSSPHRRHRNDDSPPRRKRSRSRRRDRSRSRDDRKHRDRSRERVRSRERMRSRERNGDKVAARKQKSPSPKVELNPEDRDLRTVFCMQLSTNIDRRDLADFFSKVGKVHEVHLIRDNKTRRSKGIAYVEFREIESAINAMKLNGEKLLGVPIIIQESHGDRNRSNIPITTATGKPGSSGPMKLYVGSLHFNIDEESLRKVFEPFGPIDDIKIMRDHQTGISAGYAFIQFRRCDDGRSAMNNMNGMEIAGRTIKVSSVAEHQGINNSSMFDIDESDNHGFGMTATGRVQLMAKLAEGTGLQIPKAAANVLHTGSGSNASLNAAPISTQCLVLSNMFSSNEDKTNEWEQELKVDVIEECNKHGGLLHIYVDRNSAEGNIYIKCASIASAMTTVTHLHGRYFGGKVIKAAYIPLPSYHTLFPDSIKAIRVLSASNAH